MFTLKQSSHIGGDETAAYNVILDKEYTVKELVDEVLTNTMEWGYIEVKDLSICAYKRGNIVVPLDETELSKKIDSVSACGGWGRMDYFIITK